MLDNLFQQFDAQFANSLSASVTKAVVNVLYVVHGPLTAVLTVWVIVLGVLIAWGKLNSAEAFGSIIRAGCVVALIGSSGLYTTYVQELFMNDIPTTIASAVTGSSSGASVPQQFDLLTSASIHMGAEILQGASMLSPSGIAAWILVGLIQAFVLIGMGLSFAIWESVQTLTGVLIAAGPFLIAGFLFRATHGYAARFIDALVGVAILNLLISVLLQVMIVGESGFLRQVQSVSMQTLAVQLSVFLEVSCYFGIGAFLMLMLPAKAAAIGGGAAMGAGALVGAIFAPIGSLASFAPSPGKAPLPPAPPAPKGAPAPVPFIPSTTSRP